MKGQYFFEMGNGLGITADAIDVKGSMLFMYVERMVGNNSIIACIGSIGVNDFKENFKYSHTLQGETHFIKYFKEM